MKTKGIWCLALFVGLLSHIGGEQTKETVQVISHPNNNAYASARVGSEKHKYGYELKENRHFHHTTTEQDGVRLGCYGYEALGKKYSTQYVADVKGYRPVYTHDMITVYPRSGGERKASFVNDFNEDQILSENIRYFFPDGCKGSDVNILPIELPTPPSVQKIQPVVTKKPEPGILPPKIPERPTPKPSTIPPPPNVIETTPKPVTRPPVIFTTPRPAPIPAETILTNVITPKSCPNSCCISDDENVAKLVLPIQMKNNVKGSCTSYAKLIVPVEGLNPDTLKSLTRGGNSAELIRTILQSLS